MKYFGTDGIRQKADQFTPEFLYKIARGLVDYAGDTVKVLIGGDTRESSEWIIRDLESAFENLGVEYQTIDVLPTPGINYCFYQMGFDFAVDVSVPGYKLIRVIAPNFVKPVAKKSKSLSKKNYSTMQSALPLAKIFTTTPWISTNLTSKPISAKQILKA